MLLRQFFPDNPSFGFMRFRPWSFSFSGVVSILALLAFWMIGFNTGIDFKGGILMEARSTQGAADIASLRELLEDIDIGEVQLQEFGQPSDVLIRISSKDQSEAAQQQTITYVKSTLGETNYEFRRVEVVGARVSQELVRDGIIGVLIAIFGILIYLWFRFEWQFAVGAMIATVHDLVLTIGFLAVMQLDFDLSAVAAILTIIGYSLNDTVVVFDRIRELMRRYKRIGMPELLDLAMNSTLSRTILTSVTTFLAVMALAIWGGSSVKTFAYSMAFGIFVGTYSSIFIAAPLLIYLGLTPQSVTGEKDASSGRDNS
jgi:preprotein translocase SecF subunit